ncbi:MAG TPA: hypothetical protein DDW54_01275 [Clostridiales bacterium]|nr:hypothetical protein [Clostridiales bacterium]
MIDLKKFKFKTEYVIIAVLTVAAVAILFINFGSVKTAEKSDTEKYVASLESKLSSALSKVNGAGKVSVMISVSEGVSSVIATEEKKTEEAGKTVTTANPVLVNGKPIILGEKYPEITGVVIVSKGAGNISVKMAILNAATTVLGVPANKVQILAQ